MRRGLKAAEECLDRLKKARPESMSLASGILQSHGCGGGGSRYLVSGKEDDRFLFRAKGHGACVAET